MDAIAAGRAPPRGPEVFPDAAAAGLLGARTSCPPGATPAWASVVRPTSRPSPIAVEGVGVATNSRENLLGRLARRPGRGGPCACVRVVLRAECFRPRRHCWGRGSGSGLRAAADARPHLKKSKPRGLVGSSLGLSRGGCQDLSPLGHPRIPAAIGPQGPIPGRGESGKCRSLGHVGETCTRITRSGNQRGEGIVRTDTRERCFFTPAFYIAKTSLGKSNYM